MRLAFKRELANTPARLSRWGPIVIAVVSLLLVAASSAHAANTCLSTATGNWATPGTWTGCGGVIPTSADSVEISSDKTVTVNVSNAVAASVLIGRNVNSGGGTLTFSSGSQLTVSGTVTNGSSSSGGLTTVISMTSGGTLITGHLALGSLGSPTWTPGTGTVVLTATNTLPASVFTSFNNLSTTAGTTTLGTSITVNGTLTVTGGALTIGAFTTSVTGATTVSGTLNITSTTGTKTFTGNVTINNGGIWNGSANEAISFGGSLQNDGTFTAGTGVHTFTGTAQTISGANAIAIPSLTISGTTTNNGTLTVSTTLAGASTLTNGTNATLNFGGASITPTLTATASGNTVNYSLAGAQTVKATTYNNLTLSGSGSKTTSSITVNGTLSMQGTATASAAPTYGATASLEYKGNSSQTSGPELLSTMAAGRTVVINNAAGVTLGANATVNGGLTFTSGNVTTGANTLYIGSGGTVSRTSGHVVGNFKKYIATGATNMTFEVGDASNYTPVTVVFASVTVAGDLTASVLSGDHANIGSSTIIASKSVNRNWTLTNSGIAFTSYDATFTFVAGDIDAGATTSAFIVGRYNGGWTYPTVGTKTGTTTQATGLAAFGDFQIGELPTYTISGHIQNASAVAIVGATVTLSGGQAGSTTTDASGNYSFPSLPSTNNYTVTPTLANYIFSLVSRTYNNLSGNQTTADFTAIPVYTISGHIQNGSGAQISGVSISLSGNMGGSTTTDASGNYSFANIPKGGNYTLVPSKTNYNFSPVSISYNNLSGDQAATDFTGTLVYSITVSVYTGAFVPFSGVSVVLSGSSTGSGTTDADGYCVFTNLPAGGNYTVTPSITGYAFSPTSRSANGLSNNFSMGFSGTVTYNISGHIQNAGAVSIVGATVTLSGGQSDSTTTDGSGNYSFASLTTGLNYTVTPAKTNYAFSPTSRTFNNLSAAQVADFTAALVPNVTLTASVSPTGTVQPRTDLVYTVSFSNVGVGSASAFVITDPIPTNTDFKIGSVTTSLGTTGLTPTIAYSNDGGASWTYTPSSAAGGAPAGYDRNVTHVRWTFGASLSPTSPNNAGSVALTARIW